MFYSNLGACALQGRAGGVTAAHVLFDLCFGSADIVILFLFNFGACALPVPCRDELEAIIEARVRDFRIDARLRRVCKDQMQDCVGMDIYEGDETNANICLQVSAAVS
jgi:hypothetical protein